MKRYNYLFLDIKYILIYKNNIRKYILIIYVYLILFSSYRKNNIIYSFCRKVNMLNENYKNIKEFKEYLLFLKY